MTKSHECHISPTGNHQFIDINSFERDDQGFYLQCMHCNDNVMFECDTESDFFELFNDGCDE